MGTLVFLGFVVFIGFRVIGCLLTYTPPKPLSVTETSAPESRRAIWNAPPEQSLPDNGHGLFHFNRAAVDSKLRIRPRGEQGHVVVKVEDSINARLLCWLFIRQGQSAETPIPAGSYRLKLAYGQKWYGEKDLFGPGAAYRAIANEINIPARTVYTIDLHPSAGGTLRETKLHAENF